MKVGYFIMHFPYQESFTNPALYKKYPVGGAEFAAYHLAFNMAKLGHEVHVFTNSIDAKDHTEDMGDVKVHRFATNFRILKGFFSINMFLKSWRHKVDIVHLHFSLPPTDLASLTYAKLIKKPFIVHYHGDWDSTYGPAVRRVGLKIWNNVIVKTVLNKADLIISPSEYYISQSRYLPKHVDKTITIPNGVNLEELEVSYTKKECRNNIGISESDKVILFLGVLIDYKSPDLLIKSLPLILKQTPDAKLVFVGDGPMRNELELRAKNHGLSDKVKFAGNTVGELKAQYYKAADVFVLPSALNTEVFPLVFLEAAAAGLPIVCSDVKTFSCFVENEYNGIMSIKGDINSLSEAIVRILSQPEIRQIMSDNTKNKVRSYSWYKIAQQTEDVYKQLLSA